MEGVLLFVLIVAAVIVLIAVINRRAELAREEEAENLAREALAEKSAAHRTGAAPAARPVVRTHEAEAAVKFNGQKQINMYVYAPAHRQQRCHCCDGENEINASFCKVCGTKLR